MSQINLQHGTTTNSGETGRLESKNGYAQKYISVNRSKGPATPLTLTQSAQTIREPTIIIGADFRWRQLPRGENTFRFGPPGCRPFIVGTPPSAVVTLFFRSLHYFHFVLFEFFVLQTTYRAIVELLFVTVANCLAYIIRLIVSNCFNYIRSARLNSNNIFSHCILTKLNLVSGLLGVDSKRQYTSCHVNTVHVIKSSKQTTGQVQGWLQPVGFQTWRADQAKIIPLPAHNPVDHLGAATIIQISKWPGLGLL